MDKQTLGLIAGNGKFPLLFAREAKAKNYRVIAGGIKGDTSPSLKFFVDKIKIFNVGELRKLFVYLKDQGATQAIMAGQVNPNNLFKKNLILDEEFRDLFQGIKDRKADTIFSAITTHVHGTKASSVCWLTTRLFLTAFPGSMIPSDSVSLI